MLQLYSWSIWNSADIHQSFAAAALELTTRFYFHSLPSAQDTWEGNQREREGSRRKNVNGTGMEDDALRYIAVGIVLQRKESTQMHMQRGDYIHVQRGQAIPASVM